MAKNVAGQGEQRARIGRVSHDLRGFSGGQRPKLHLAWSVHRGIHEDDFGSAGDGVSQLRS
jgi:hypothetical protein